MKIEELEKRARNLHRHVQEHPADYVAVVAEMELQSAIIDKARKDIMNERLKRVSEIRRRRNEKQRQRDGNGRGHSKVDSSARSSGDTLSDAI